MSHVQSLCKLYVFDRFCMILKQIFFSDLVSNFGSLNKVLFLRFDGSAQEALDKVKSDEKFMLSGKEASTVVRYLLF